MNAKQFVGTWMPVLAMPMALMVAAGCPGQTVIDMPPPIGLKAVASAVQPTEARQAVSASLLSVDAVAMEVDEGSLALERYARARFYPSDIQYSSPRAGVRYYDSFHYGYPFWFWWPVHVGHCH